MGDLTKLFSSTLLGIFRTESAVSRQAIAVSRSHHWTTCRRHTSSDTRQHSGPSSGVAPSFSQCRHTRRATMSEERLVGLKLGGKFVRSRDEFWPTLICTRVSKPDHKPNVRAALGPASIPPTRAATIASGSAILLAYRAWRSRRRTPRLTARVKS